MQFSLSVEKLKKKRVWKLAFIVIKNAHIIGKNEGRMAFLKLIMR